MAKQSGLGDNFYIGGNNLSGDVGSLGTISSGHTPLDITGIDKSAMERLGGQRSGTIEFTAFFNDATSPANQEHAALKSGWSSGFDRVTMYTRGTSIGSAAACQVSKQVNYDGTRGADGSFTFNVQALSNAYGQEWGQLLTAGVRTDTGATNGASLDTTASASFGGQAYLEVFQPFTGTDATIKIQDSADDAAWADVASFAFTAVTAAPTAERIALSNTATIRRYVRVITTTSAGFTSLSFAVAVVKNQFAGQVF